MSEDHRKLHNVEFYIGISLLIVTMFTRKKEAENALSCGGKKKKKKKKYAKGCKFSKKKSETFLWYPEEGHTHLLKFKPDNSPYRSGSLALNKFAEKGILAKKRRSNSQI